MWTLIIQLVLSDPSAPRCPLVPAEIGSQCMLPGPAGAERLIGTFANEKQCMWEMQRWVGIEPAHNRTADVSELRDLPPVRRGQQWIPVTARCQAPGAAS